MTDRPPTPTGHGHASGLRVLMLVLSDLDRDARVRREAAALAQAGHRVTVIALAGRSQPGVQVIGVGRPRGPALSTASRGIRRRVRRVLRWALLPEHLASMARRFATDAGPVATVAGPFDVVHAHDFSTLPLGARLAEDVGARLVYDAHECWVGRYKDGRDDVLRDLLHLRKERALGARADAVITVSPMLARWLGARLGRSVAVVRNTFPDLDEGWSPAPTSPPVGLVYAGLIAPGRDLETLVAAADGLPVEPVLVGPRSGPVDLGSLSPRSPVPVDDVDRIHAANGLAFVPLTDDCLNHRLALPNKLFQAVRAGTPVVAADLPQIRDVVTTFGLGTLYTPGDPASLHRAVVAAVEGHDRFVAAVARARTPLSWAADAAVLVDTYRQL
ncbi:glycosyltransferase [Euzebya pacifica]|uniref:glycosyltransferase n=1 Tax=Euzebya pacifica TaxID=1608957 RepID=UPI0030F8EF5D